MFSRLLDRFGLAKATLITTLMVVVTSLFIAFVVNTLIGRQMTLQTYLVSVLVPFFAASPFIYHHFSLLLKLVASEQVLQENTKVYKNLLNNIPGIVYRGHADWTTEIISEGNGICGYTEKEINLFEQGWLQVVHPEDLKGLMEQSDGLLQEENNLVQTYRIISKNGDIHWVQDWKNSSFSADGEFLGVDGIIFDITEQHKMAERLRRTHNLESIGILAGGLAHDFNNILAGILGNINLVLLDTSLQERTRDMLLRAEKASLRATDLTQQLLTFAEGGGPIRETAFLEDVIKDSANFVLQGDHAACRYDIPEDLWRVDIDKGQIGQVIQNIVLNASQAMPDGGIIPITCENLVGAGADGSPIAKGDRFVMISIKDSGVGMATNVVDKIFDPYFSTKQVGNGLGLAITQSIISKHNGHITVESSRGAGTTFTIYLPVSCEQL